MWEFIQSYWGWIVFGGLSLFMLRAHGHGGGGCGMGGHEDTRRDKEQGVAVDARGKGDESTRGGCH